MSLPDRANAINALRGYTQAQSYRPTADYLSQLNLGAGEIFQPQVGTGAILGTITGGTNAFQPTTVNVPTGQGGGRFTPEPRGGILGPGPD
ncbi:MAG: hypothetical protein ACRDH5_05800, partial [bacterium]